MLPFMGALERWFAIPMAVTHFPFGVCTPTMTPGVAASRNPAWTAAFRRARCRAGSGELDLADAAVTSPFLLLPAASPPQPPTSTPTTRTSTAPALPGPIHRHPS